MRYLLQHNARHIGFEKKVTKSSIFTVLNTYVFGGMELQRTIFSFALLRETLAKMPISQFGDRSVKF